MTGIYFFARRDGERIPVEIDRMTDDELDALLARSNPEALPGLVKALAVFIRDNVAADAAGKDGDDA